MAHELETLANGQVAFVSARQSAWHRLGTVTSDLLTAEQALTTAHLGNWNVRKIKIQGVEMTPDGVNLIEADDKRMTVRTNVLTGETEYLGIVGMLTDLVGTFSLVKSPSCYRRVGEAVSEIVGVPRDLAALRVLPVGCLQATGDGWAPFVLLDPEGVVVEAVAVFLRELSAQGRAEATLRSYGMDLLRW